jgi:hypothetical protein
MVFQMVIKKYKARFFAWFSAVLFFAFSPFFGCGDECTPLALYGPAPPCDSDEYCTNLNGPNWYCDKTTFDNGCGKQASWPTCRKNEGS